MGYLVEEVVAAAVPTAVVAESTTWAGYPSLWPRLLDEVWAAVRGSAAIRPGRNVMVYRDLVPGRDVAVEVGVVVDEPFEAIGRVVCSSLPTGRALAATHRGAYTGLGAAHHAVTAERARRGLGESGVRWEVYGH